MDPNLRIGIDIYYERDPDQIILGSFFFGKNHYGIILPSHLVYGWRREFDGKKLYLYIGKSTSGKERFLFHQVINKVEPVLSSDFIDLWFDEPKRLAPIEYCLQRNHNPKYNKYGTHEKRSRKIA